ncbi:Di-N-acetylchitobiase [Lamellibrachia satsuma]|nr:Di-N-acetylchitobiase [Lamellibrachia satsuma]
MAMKLFVICLFLKAASLSGSAAAPKCPCSDPRLCDPILSTPKKETFVFSVSGKNWMRYDWKKITTIGVTYTNVSLVCYAHSRGVKVVKLVDFTKGNLTDVSDRHRWVLEQVKYVEDNFLDGLNVDYEKGIRKDQPKLRDGLTALVKELSMALHSHFKNPQVTFDVPYLPGGYRHYDYSALANIVDFMFIMAYDEAYGDLIAWANCPLSQTAKGLKQFLQLGIPADKLVLGLPWYGYNYQCLHYTKDNKCYTKKVPLHGAVFSDTTAASLPYSAIKGLLNTSFTGKLWDSIAQSPYFAYKRKDTGDLYQVWYDDPQSLRIKYKLADNTSLRGVGMWEADTLNYTDTPEASSCITFWLCYTFGDIRRFRPAAFELNRHPTTAANSTFSKYLDR